VATNHKTNSYEDLSTRGSGSIDPEKIIPGFGMYVNEQDPAKIDEEKALLRLQAEATILIGASSFFGVLLASMTKKVDLDAPALLSMHYDSSVGGAILKYNPMFEGKQPILGADGKETIIDVALDSLEVIYVLSHYALNHFLRVNKIWKKFMFAYPKQTLRQVVHIAAALTLDEFVSEQLCGSLARYKDLFPLRYPTVKKFKLEQHQTLEGYVLTLLKRLESTQTLNGSNGSNGSSNDGSGSSREASSESKPGSSSEGSSGADQSEGLLAKMLQVSSSRIGYAGDMNGDTVDGPIDARLAQWEQFETAIENHLRSAVSQAKSRGISPGFAEEILEQFSIPPRRQWHLKLRGALGNSLDRIQRERRISLNLRKLSLIRMKPKYSPNIVVAIDTSASMGQEELQMAVSEAFGAAKRRGGELTVVQCDADIQAVQVFRTNRSCIVKDFKVKGRGGTRFSPVMKWVMKQRKRIHALVYVTDGYGEPNVLEPEGTDVIWVVPEEFDIPAPFGTVIQITRDEEREIRA